MEKKLKTNLTTKMKKNILRTKLRGYIPPAAKKVNDSQDYFLGWESWKNNIHIRY